MSNTTPFKVPSFDKSLHKGEGDLASITDINNIPDYFILEGWFVGLKSLQDK